MSANWNVMFGQIYFFFVHRNESFRQTLCVRECVGRAAKKLAISVARSHPPKGACDGMPSLTFNLSHNLTTTCTRLAIVCLLASVFRFRWKSLLFFFFFTRWLLPLPSLLHVSQRTRPNLGSPPFFIVPLRWPHHLTRARRRIFNKIKIQ